MWIGVHSWFVFHDLCRHETETAKTHMKSPKQTGFKIDEQLPKEAADVAIHKAAPDCRDALIANGATKEAVAKLDDWQAVAICGEQAARFFRGQ